MNQPSGKPESPTSGFGARLKEERARLELSQTVFAARTGIAKPTLIAYEQGIRFPDVGYLNALTEIGADIVYIVHGVRAKKYAASIFDWELLGDIAEALESWCSGCGVNMSARRRQEIERHLYEHFVSDEKMDTAGMDRMLRLVFSKE